MKPAPDCKLTGLPMMQTECRACLKTILFFKYNGDGKDRIAPRYHSGHCLELGRIMKANKLLKRQQKRLDKRAQTALSFI